MLLLYYSKILDYIFITNPLWKASAYIIQQSIYSTILKVAWIIILLMMHKHITIHIGGLSIVYSAILFIFCRYILAICHAQQ